MTQQARRATLQATGFGPHRIGKAIAAETRHGAVVVHALFLA
jgi:hypothetical protein